MGDNEPRIVVSRIELDNGMIEYQASATTVHRIDQRMDRQVPDEYIAAYVANSLRELVNSAMLRERVNRRIGKARSEGPRMFVGVSNKVPPLSIVVADGSGGISNYVPDVGWENDGGLIADVLAPVCVDEKERRAFERGRVHERFAQQIFKEATS